MYFASIIYLISHGEILRKFESYIFEFYPKIMVIILLLPKYLFTCTLFVAVITLYQKIVFAIIKKCHSIITLA